MATPRRALGDVKNVFGSAAKPFGSTLKQPVKPLGSALKQASAKRLLDFTDITNAADFNKNSGDSINLTPRKPIEAIKEEELPIERCSCDHGDHGFEQKCTLPDHETKFEPTKQDTVEMDDWLSYYYGIERKVTSWRQFLAQNDLI